MVFHVATNVAEILGNLKGYSPVKIRVLGHIRKYSEDLDSLVKVNDRIEENSKHRLILGPGDDVDMAIDEIVYETLPSSVDKTLPKLREYVEIAIELGLGENKVVRYYAKEFKIAPY